MAIFCAFLYIGTVGFGGGLAILAQIQQYVVEKMKWLSPPEFVESVAVIQALPGVIAVNISCFVGFKIRRWCGAAVAVLGMVLPAFLSMLLLSEIYLRFHSVPELERIFRGMTPAIVAFIVLAAYQMGRTSMKSYWDWILAIFAFAALSLLKWGIVLTVLISGAIGFVMSQVSSREWKLRECLGGLILLASLIPAVTVSSEWIWPMFTSFLKIGAFTFGGGYVMVPILEGEYVHRFHWLTHREFVDSVALGQITPGPVVITATFVGYKVAGLAGAILATVAVFLPSFLITAAVSYSYQRFRDNQMIQAFLRGVTPAVVGLLASAVYSLGRISIQGYWSWGIAVLTFVIAARFKVNALWIILVAGGLGWLAG